MKSSGGGISLFSRPAASAIASAAPSSSSSSSAAAAAAAPLSQRTHDTKLPTFKASASSSSAAVPAVSKSKLTAVAKKRIPVAAAAVAVANDDADDDDGNDGGDDATAVAEEAEDDSTPTDEKSALSLAAGKPKAKPGMKLLRVTTFKELGLGDRLIRTCHAMGLQRPTDIQVQCIPHILAGKDLIGRAKTGSGKTAAFALPILQKWAADPYGVFAVVLTPTRELAFQIADQFRVFGAEMQLKDCVIIGGQDMLLEARELSNRPHVIIATPGRLAHHIASNTVAVTTSASAKAGATGTVRHSAHTATLHLAHVKFLVLDEADRLLMDQSFAKPLTSILSVLPAVEERQTLLFSATLPTVLPELGAVTKPDPVHCQVSSDENAFVETLDQRYLFIPVVVKETYLVYILKHTEFSDSSCIIFTSTKERCERIAEFLMQMDVPNVESLHSGKNQARRNASLGKFRSGAARVLVATDVASRGLDIPTVRLVINFDVPSVIPDYVHRVGRTARAGRAGVSITLVSQSDVALFTAIETFVGKTMTEYQLPEQKVLSLLKKVFTTKVVTEIRLDEYKKKLNRNRTLRHTEPIDRPSAGGGDEFVESATATAPATSKRKHFQNAGSATKKSKS